MSTIEISQMIDLIEDHFSPRWGSNQVLTVGGIAGTAIFKHAIHACLKYHDFTRILVVDGCQDYIGLLRKPILNYVYYIDLFKSIPIPALEVQMQPFHRFPMEMISGYQYQLNESFISHYDAMIINNAHLIPDSFLKAFELYFQGKILHIVDPLDLNGIDFHGIPTLYDSLSKQTSVIALARSMYGIDTRGIDRKIKCEFKKIKMSKRGIGKLDTNQYVSNSNEILKQIQNKQLQSQFRKSQKFIVASEEIRFVYDQNGNTTAIGPNSMLHILSVTKPLMKLRIHASMKDVYMTLSYQPTQRALYVKPANIMSIDDIVHHRFQSIVVVLGDEPMTNRTWYSLLKIANQINVVEY